jgi:paraquat-inducible protein B
VSRRANPTLIGAFVVGALALFVAAVLIISGGLFGDSSRFVMYFEGSVKGLRVGAPVDFRGVKIGEVTDIRIEADYAKNKYTIPVVAKLDRRGITEVTESERGVPLDLSELVDRGLRAQLSLQNLLTGQLYVQVDFESEAEAVFHGDGEMVEIPTIPTPLEKLQKSLSDFDIDGLIDDISSTMNAIETLTNSPALKRAIANLDESMASINTLARNMDENMVPVLNNLNKTLVEARQTLDEVRAAAESAEGTLGADSELVYGVQNTLDEISRAARSVNELADMLERNPESLLQGKDVQ